MNLSDLLHSLLNWFVGVLGILALMFGLSLMPALFGNQDPDSIFLTLDGVSLSKGILGFFSYPFGIVLLVVSTTLFTWVSLLFSMSFHALIESIIYFFDDDREESVVGAWVAVLVANFLFVSMFVYILFGMIMTPATLLIGGLMLAAMAALLAANYRESYHV